MTTERNTGWRRRTALVAMLMTASMEPSYAYVDPGTGSMLIQMAIAGIAGALFFLRQWRLQFTDWIRRTVLGRSDAKPATPEVTDPISKDAD